ncbi:MAG: phage baseplate assembly protein [Polaromonas sp.]|nr:phage baseplate assembly protein [Polaromonas sp.]
MKGLRNAMAGAAEQVANARPTDTIGIVDGYDPSTFTVKVRVQPADVLTGWIPLPTHWVGNGWGMQVAPALGDVVTLGFQGGGIDTAVVTGYVFNDGQRPLSVPSGEFWLTHKLGAMLRLLNTGAAVFSDGHGATITLNGDGTITSTAGAWAHTGPVTITGTLTTTDAITGGAALIVAGAGTFGGAVSAPAVSGGGTSLHTHVHGGVQTGGGSTGGPS